MTTPIVRNAVACNPAIADGSLYLLIEFADKSVTKVRLTRETLLESLELIREDRVTAIVKEKVDHLESVVAELAAHFKRSIQ